MELIERIRKELELEVRVYSGPDKYFEAVFQSENLDTLLALLRDTIGEPLKPPGKKVKFPKHVQKLINLIGGIWDDQSFYLKEEVDGGYLYVALWPWQSDPTKITLKIDRGSFPV